MRSHPGGLRLDCPGTGARWSHDKETELVSIKNQLIRAAAVGTRRRGGHGRVMAPGLGWNGRHAPGPQRAWRGSGKPNIEHRRVAGKTVHYSPTTLKVKWSGPTKKTCTAKNITFTISNTTKAQPSRSTRSRVRAFAKIPPARPSASACSGRAPRRRPRLGLCSQQESGADGQPSASVSRHAAAGRQPVSRGMSAPSAAGSTRESSISKNSGTGARPASRSARTRNRRRAEMTADTASL